jgi:hypothetical protein
MLPGLNVSMQYPFSVGGVEGIRRLHPEVQQLGVGHGPAEIRPVEALAFEQFHHDEGLVAAFVQLVDGADAGMVERRSGARLAPETLQRRRVLARGLGQQLDGDGAAQLLVFSFVNYAHTPLAKATDDPVVTKHGTCT